MLSPRRSTALEVPRLEWPAFLRSFAWRQGEHMSAIGPTGAGKSALLLELIRARADLSRNYHALIVATKPRDRTLERLARSGEWRRLEAWPPAPTDRRVILWPRWRDPSDNARQAAAIRTAIGSVFASGSWCVNMDETDYAIRTLRLEDELTALWQQGRSLGISVVAAAQRPAHVPLLMYSQATHLWFWRTNDKRDLDRIAGLGAADSTTIKDVVANLDFRAHELLYVNTRSGRLARTIPVL